MEFDLIPLIRGALLSLVGLIFIFRPKGLIKLEKKLNSFLLGGWLKLGNKREKTFRILGIILIVVGIVFLGDAFLF